MDTQWQNQLVLVTGAGGFIGSHLVEALLGLGARVRAFVRYNSRQDPGLLKLISQPDQAQIEIIFGDLRDASAVQQAMTGVSLVFHLGASISIPYSYRHPAEVVETNVIGTLNVLLAARQAGIARLLHTSSSEVYGTALQAPMGENHPLQGQSPYSASKIGADKLVESFHLAFDLPTVTVRPFNTYGPRQSARAVIPAIITQALTEQAVHLGNLDASRDFTHVSDIVNGFLLAAQAPDVTGETFNLGSGQDIRVADLARMIIEITGQPVPIVIDSQRLRPERSEVQRLLSDTQHARERLGWAPQIGLNEGLIETVQWIKDHLHRYEPGLYQI